MRKRTVWVLLLALNLVISGCAILDRGPVDGPTTEPLTPAPTAIPPIPTDTPIPATPVPALDAPLVLLDTYPSLATVAQRLDGMIIIHSDDGSSMIGRQMLEWILVGLQYNPMDDNSTNEQVFASLDEYDFPYPGARTYLINVATGLFAESHGLYPWSLQDYSVQDVDNVFIEDSSTQVMDPTRHRGDWDAGMPNLYTHTYPVSNGIIEDAHYKQFNLARSLTQGAASQEAAAGLLVVWMQQNFFHAIDGYTWEVYLDGREPLEGGGPAAFPLSIERIYEERVSGCHEPTILLEGMLHSLNVPAVRIKVHGHGVLYLPTLDRYVHGDHVVAYTDAPPGMLMLTADEFRPFAEDVGSIYAIVYPDKYQSPFISMPLWRDGGFLHIYSGNVRDFAAGTCLQVSTEDWERVTQQLEAYNLQYDTEGCVLSSDMLPILTLGQLAP